MSTLFSIVSGLSFLVTYYLMMNKGFAPTLMRVHPGLSDIFADDFWYVLGVLLVSTFTLEPFFRFIWRLASSTRSVGWFGAITTTVISETVLAAFMFIIFYSTKYVLLSEFLICYMTAVLISSVIIALGADFDEKPDCPTKEEATSKRVNNQNRSKVVIPPIILGYILGAACFSISGICALMIIFSVKGISILGITGWEAVFACYGTTFLILCLVGSTTTTLGRVLLTHWKEKFPSQKMFETAAYATGVTLMILLFAAVATIGNDARSLSGSMILAALVIFVQAVLAGFCYSRFIHETEYADTSRLTKFLG